MKKPFPVPPSAAEYKSGFEAILERLNDNQIAMLRAHYEAPGHRASVHSLAQKCGIASWRTVNRQYGEIAKLLLSEMGYDKPRNNDGELWLTGICFWYEGMEMFMRPEVVKALEETGIVKSLLVALPEEVKPLGIFEAEMPEISTTFRSESDSRIEKYERDPNFLKRTKRILLLTGKGESANAAHNAIIRAFDGGHLLDRNWIEDFSLLTQNVDGSNDLVELHGDVNEARCLSCGHTESPKNVVREEARWHECPKCRGHGTTVLCRIMLDDDELQNAREKAKACEYCIVAGSSDVSSSLMYIAEVAKQTGAYLVEINEEKTEVSEIADEFVQLNPDHLLPFIHFLRHEVREHNQTDSADLTTDSKIQSLKTSGTQPIRVEFIRSEGFPLLNRLGMVFAPGLSLDEGEAGRLQLGDRASEDDITLIRLQVPADKEVPDSMTDVVAMAVNFRKALRQGEIVIVHCKDNQAFVSLTAACIAIAATDGKISASEAIELVRVARPGAIETEAQEQFIQEFAKEWREVMATRGDHYLLYWQERSVLDHAANEVPLDVVASNGLFGVEQGDKLWIVTLTQDRELFLAGRLVVGEIVEHEEAIRRMPDAGLWQSEYYAFPEPGTEEFFRPLPLTEIAEELRFDDENDRLMILDGQINPQQLRSRRKLTSESAELITDIWEESATLTDPEELVEAWQQMVDENPDDPDAHYNLAVALSDVGRSDEAVREYQETIRLDPNYLPALYNLGNHWVHSQRYEEAIELFNRAILVDGDIAPVHFMLGVAYFESGRYEDAVEASRHGLQVDPDDESAYYNLAYWAYRMGDYRSALAQCDDLIARAPLDQRIRLLKGKCFKELGELENEIRAYKDVLAVSEDEDEWGGGLEAMYALGAAWERKITGSDTEIEYLEVHGKVDFDNPKEVFYLAMAQIAQGKSEYAQTVLDMLQHEAPDLARRLEFAIGVALH